MNGAVTLSGLLAYLNGARLPAKVAADIKAEARERLCRRLAAGKANGILDFSDLVERGEASLLGGLGQ